ncbi:TPA: DUF4111 domain-containing protein [Providencia stuartii]|nr:DUF4111 domain-containing protein [Providencia stuartii]
MVHHEDRVIYFKGWAANWAIDLMPTALSSIIIMAKNDYLTGASTDWADQTEGIKPCVDYLAECIRTCS